MASRITLPGAHRGVRVSGGVRFVDGVGEAETLSSHQRQFFRMKGATIDEADDRTVAELRAELEAVYGVDWKRSWRKSELIERLDTLHRLDQLTTPAEE